MTIEISKDFIVVALIVVLVVAVTAGLFGVVLPWLGKHDPLTHGPRITALRNGDYSFFSAEVQTHGNRSFIPMGLQAAPADYSAGIGKLVDGFCQSHPQLHMVSWGVDWKMAGRDASSIHSFWIDGIWIEHVSATVK